MRITEFIPNGKADAVSMKDLAAILGISKRGVRALVLAAREHGASICSTSESDKGGYYMPRDREEAVAYLKQQKARIKSAYAALNGIRKFLKEV